MKNIILDTDLDTDCDDAGALALLHNFELEGACKIAAVICDAPTKDAVLYASIVNAYYGHSNIPIGYTECSKTDSFDLYFQHRKKCKDADVLYNEKMADKYAHLLKQKPTAEDAITLYRKTLANAPDKSIDICCIGLLTILAELISSAPCIYSKLNGIELIQRKINKLVIMGKGKFPTGEDSFNWHMAPYAAAKVLNHWPGKVIISPLGSDILTGRELVLCKDNNPIADAYRFFLKKDCTRPSWDPIAVLYTVLESKKLFRLRKGFSILFNPENGKHQWVQKENSQTYLLEKNTTTENLTSVIDHFLIPKPKCS